MEGTRGGRLPASPTAGRTASQQDDPLARERAARRAAEHALKRAELFVAVLGHELRNPLTAIVAAAELLDERTKDPPDRELLERIATSARRVDRIGGQLLDVARVRSGSGIVLTTAPCDLRAIVHAARAEVLSARTAEIRVKVRGHTEGVWDSDRLVQVFSNLLANGVDHSLGDGPVRVTVDGEQEDCVRVYVRNSGTIPAERLPSLFEPFQAGNGRRRGLGLGLYIARELVLAHDGTIYVRSTPDNGTTVVLRLPRGGEDSTP